MGSLNEPGCPGQAQHSLTGMTKKGYVQGKDGQMSAGMDEGMDVGLIANKLHGMDECMLDLIQRMCVLRE